LNQVPLTEKENRIYSYIKTYFAEHQRPPTYQEIQKEFSYSAISTVQDFLSQLRTKGYIRAPFGENRKRAIELVDFDSNETDDITRLPLLGKVAAGRPIEAIETRDYVEIPRSLLRQGGEYFALTVKGDSMIEDCIMEGDYVIIKRQASAANGQTVVAIVDNQATIKRFYQRGGNVELHPANPNYSVIHVEPHSEFKILGVLSSVIRRLE
jgi:repressor LexA